MEINDPFYSNLVVKLQQSIPQFPFDELDPPYLIMFEFGQFMIENIADDRILESCCDFINQAIVEGHEETETMVVLQVFQSLYEQKSHLKKFREYFLPEVIKIFDDSYIDYLRHFDSEG